MDDSDFSDLLRRPTAGALGGDNPWEAAGEENGGFGGFNNPFADLGFSTATAPFKNDTTLPAQTALPPAATIGSGPSSLDSAGPTAFIDEERALVAQNLSAEGSAPLQLTVDDNEELEKPLRQLMPRPKHAAKAGGGVVHSEQPLSSPAFSVPPVAKEPSISEVDEKEPGTELHAEASSLPTAELNILTPPEEQGATVAEVSVQPQVENAIKTGLMPDVSPMNAPNVVTAAARTLDHRQSPLAISAAATEATFQESPGNQTPSKSTSASESPAPRPDVTKTNNTPLFKSPSNVAVSGEPGAGTWSGNSFSSVVTARLPVDTQPGSRPISPAARSSPITPQPNVLVSTARTQSSAIFDPLSGFGESGNVSAGLKLPASVPASAPGPAKPLVPPLPAKPGVEVLPAPPRSSMDRPSSTASSTLSSSAASVSVDPLGTASRPLDVPVTVPPIFPQVAPTGSGPQVAIMPPAVSEPQFASDSVALPTAMPHFEISVGEPSRVGGLDAHTSYRIRTKTNSTKFRNPEVTVQRRYRDFLWLINQLTISHPGVIIPPIPEKQTMGRFQEDFVESRRAAFERALQKISTHPLLFDDSDVKIFLESETFSTDASMSTKKDPSKGMFSAFSLSSTPFRATPDRDEFLDARKMEIDKFESQLRQLMRAVEVLVNKRKELGSATNDFGEAILALSGSESDQTLSGKLKRLGTISRKIKEVQERQAKNDMSHLAFMVEEYIRFCASVGVAYESRTKTWDKVKTAEGNLINRRVALDKARASGKKGDKLTILQAEIDETEVVLKQAQKEFADVSATLRDELARFDRDKVLDLVNALQTFLDALVSTEKEVVSLWESYFRA